MRKVIAAINMTLDGFCDHTAVIADDELHEHYTDLLKSADTILYGRVTYQLMEYWRAVVENPTGNKSVDEFAVTMDKIPKIVFSKTLKTVEWKTARLAKRELKEEVLELKQSSNGGSKNILAGSPGLIVALTNLNLIDEFQICVQPIVSGGGLPLFKNINERINLKFLKTITHASGSIILYYNIVS
ncbi:MAG: dihydrofolate reductase family protein [Ginsengibacter sp.]